MITVSQKRLDLHGMREGEECRIITSAQGVRVLWPGGDIDTAILPTGRGNRWLKDADDRHRWLRLAALEPARIYLLTLHRDDDQGEIASLEDVTPHTALRPAIRRPEVDDPHAPAPEWAMTGDRPSTGQLLGQADIWIDGSGRTHQIAEMDLRYCENVLAHLLRRAGDIVNDLYRQILRGPVPNGEMAADALDAISEELADAAADPIPWIRRQPLVQALEERLESFELAPDKERTVTVVLRLKVPRRRGLDTVRRSIDKTFKGLAYEHEIITLTE